MINFIGYLAILMILSIGGLDFMTLSYWGVGAIVLMMTTHAYSKGLDNGAKIARGE